MKRICCAFNPTFRTSKPTDNPTSFALLPYVQTTYGRLSRMLAKPNIKCVGLPPRQISSFLRPVIDNLDLRTPRVYSMPCEFGQVYCTSDRLVDLYRAGWKITSGMYSLDLQTSAVAEHKFNHNHFIKSQDTWILSTVRGYMEWLIREVDELELHPDGLNMEEGLTLSGAWKPLFCLLRRPPL